MKHTHKQLLYDIYIYKWCCKQDYYRRKKKVDRTRSLFGLIVELCEYLDSLVFFMFEEKVDGNTHILYCLVEVEKWHQIAFGSNVGSPKDL